MHIVLTILAFIAMLAITVAIHEGGHFVTAKLFKVHVHEFSIGMGPKLFQKKRKETTYSIRLLPVGGFVSMAGESVNSNIEADKDVPEEHKFCNQKYWKKLIILVAGVFMNFVLATILLSTVVLVNGKYSAPVTSVIESVSDDGGAKLAGLKPGDRITHITNNNGSDFSVSDILDIQMSNFSVEEGDILTITYERDGVTKTTTLVPTYNEDTKSYILGVVCASQEEHDVKWYTAPYYGIRYAIDNLVNTVKSFKILGANNGLKALSGPVGIAHITGSAVSSGILPYIYLIAIVNISIGFVNLLPLPVLDGGQVVLETIQRLARKRIPEKVTVLVSAATWIVLILLMLVITYNDIGNIITQT